MTPEEARALLDGLVATEQSDPHATDDAWLSLQLTLAGMKGPHAHELATLHTLGGEAAADRIAEITGEILEELESQLLELHTEVQAGLRESIWLPRYDEQR